MGVSEIHGPAFDLPIVVAHGLEPAPPVMLGRGGDFLRVGVDGGAALGGLREGAGRSLRAAFRDGFCGQALTGGLGTT